MSRTRCLTLLGFLFLAVLPGEVRAAAFHLRGEASLVCGTGLDFDIREGLIFVNKRGMAKEGWEANAAGKVATWVARYGSVTFNLLGREFPWAGMNEAGLVLSSVGLAESECEAPDSRPVAGDAFWVQHMLDNCATVDELIGHTDSIRLARTVDHYLVCDAGGDCAVIEFLGGRMVVHRGVALPVAALTGASYEDSLAAYREKRIWQLMRGLGDGWDDPLYRFIRTARKTGQVRVRPERTGRGRGCRHPGIPGHVTTAGGASSSTSGSGGSAIPPTRIPASPDPRLRGSGFQLRLTDPDDEHRCRWTR